MTDKIKSFQWAGINKLGKRVKGVVSAVDINAAQYELVAKGVEVISLKPQLEFFSMRRKKIKTKEILYFARYLSTMISAGMPILQAFDIIAKDQDNENMRSLVLSIRASIASGKNLAESFSEHPEYFNELFCSLVSAGEKSGTLEKILKRIATFLENTERLKGKIKRALIYPTIVISVAVIVTLILLLFVVPQFEAVFKSAGAQLPYFTRKVISISNFIRNNSIGIIIVGILAVWLFRFSLRRSEHLRERFDAFKLKIWVIGPVIRKGILARFTSTLAITLEAGLPIVESMTTMADVMSNILYKKAVLQIRDDLGAGHTLASSMENTGLFPNMVIQMITVGETSGSLPDMLNHINHVYEEEVNNTVDNLSNILEPIIIVLLGIIIGSFVVAMYLPIFKLGSVIR